ncbi:hypothetical protein QWJ26_12135 [Streptomyces sp. CSDS2]|uniref:hypothetical protein n=1 Tax=Streptomyces sp. CSDS2 TaxID=3055051 RepID=UPI0025AF16A1|nr:hypothetical protein [Streptomyces sp. CSDS2]MDN3260549.1 hypothetical protein [Streptomyces sp. CSDS2]
MNPGNAGTPGAGGRGTAPGAPTGSPAHPPHQPPPASPRLPSSPQSPSSRQPRSGRRTPGRWAGRLGRLVSRPVSWATGTGARPADGGSTTARDLALRHRLLLALSALLTLSLFVSYQGVHDGADPLRTSTAPAVLSLDTALYALGQAQRAAAQPAPTSDFQKQISVAVQSLAAAAADDDLGGPGGRQALQTVAGLITVYAVKVQQSQLQPDGSVLREAYLSYATSVLTEKGAGIQDRLRALQRQERAAVHRQTSFGPLLWLAWSVTLLLALALTAALLETQRFLRRRFRRRYNRQLIAAGLLLLAGVAVTVLFTVWTQAGMTDTRTLLDRPLPGRLIPDAGRHTASYLSGTGFRAAAAVWILIGGALLMALAETGLRRHINDYRFKPR